MAQLNVRLDDHVRDAFDALARARGQNGSDLIRNLIDTALGRDDPRRPEADPAPPSLSAFERQTLSLQHQILARLPADPNEDGDVQYHRNMVEVLNHGWTTEYPSLFGVMHPEVPRRECSLVQDILDMFTNLERSLEQIPEERRSSLGEHVDHALTFRGFDYNDELEGRLASYAQYLISTDRWPWMAFRFDAAHEHGNSHTPTLASYERMLSVWRPIWQRKVTSFGGGHSRYLCTPDELRQILAAWPYPKT